MALLVPAAESKAAREAFLRGLSDLESTANRAMLRQYGLTLDRVSAEMAKVLSGRTTESAAMQGLFGGQATAARLAIIRGRASYVLTELQKFGVKGQQIVAGAPKEAVALGVKHGAARIEQVAGSFTHPNPSRIERTVARLADGTQGRAYFDRFATQGAQKAVDTMTQGVIMGNHPDVIVRALRDQMDVGNARLASMVRTEVMGAARDGLHDTMQANSDVCTGWIWNAAEDETTCEVCWSMNGTVHDISEPMDETHVNCRCIQDPTTASYDSLLAA